jgi:hypothetical protein
VKLERPPRRRLAVIALVGLILIALKLIYVHLL